MAAVLSAFFPKSDIGIDSVKYVIITRFFVNLVLLQLY